MGTVRSPIPAKLFVGMIAKDIGLFTACAERLTASYGYVDIQSEILPWEHSDYYRAEMGSNLRRVFIFFDRLIDPGELPSIKHFTAQLEKEYSISGRTGSQRRINLDPGYVTEAKVVLSTTKDFPHRIYIGGNLYAESTLYYSKHSGTYMPVEHTYPDFRTESCRDLFNKAREKLRQTLHID